MVVLLLIAGAILEPDAFPTKDNIFNVLRQGSVVGVLAIGMTFVIATAGIDLSVGSMVAAAGVAGGTVRTTRAASSFIARRARPSASLLGAINARPSPTAGSCRSSRRWRCSRSPGVWRC